MKKNHLYIIMLEKAVLNKSKLHKVVIIDKKGKKETKWKKNGEIKKPDRSFWMKKFSKYKLSRYPDNTVKPSAVKVDLKGDIHSKPVLVWKDVRTNKQQASYTPQYYLNQSKKKWDRVKDLNETKINSIKVKANKVLTSGNDVEKQIGASILIMLDTGLRVGGRQNYRKTKNRGVVTLSPNNINTKSGNINFNFVGKKFQENNANMNDAKLAKYLKELKQINRKEDFIFNNIDRRDVDKYFKETMGEKKYLLKDIRTFVANKIAMEILFKDKFKLSSVQGNDNKKKSALRNKLKELIGIVAQKLNNTYSNAKNSYITPDVLAKYYKQVGAKKEHISKSILDDLNNETLDSFCATENDLKYIINVNKALDTSKLKKEVHVNKKGISVNKWVKINSKLNEVDKGNYSGKNKSRHDLFPHILFKKNFSDYEDEIKRQKFDNGTISPRDFAQLTENMFHAYNSKDEIYKVVMGLIKPITSYQWTGMKSEELIDANKGIKLFEDYIDDKVSEELKKLNRFKLKKDKDDDD